jgi:hypothetical protein
MSKTKNLHIEFFAVCATLVLMIAAFSARAESRAAESFYTPAQLKEMSSLVFEGTVVEIETNAQYKVAFPAKAAVANVLKGKLETKELTFKHKDPGKFIILGKEYNAPQFGQSGTFYIEDQGGTLVLIGYIKKTEQPSAGDALKAAPQIVRPITVTNCCAVAERSDALTFVNADNKTLELKRIEEQASE